MSSFTRFCVALALIANLVNLGNISASEKPLGVILLATSAYIDKGTAGLGADVYPGDSLKTDPGGTLRLKLGVSQFYILSASDAFLSQSGNQVRAKITQGTAGFSSAEGKQFGIETPIATVRAADGQRAFGQITLTGPQKMLVSAYRGDLVVEWNGMARTIKAGEAYNVTYVPDPTPPPVPPSPAPPQSNGSGNGKGQLIFDAVVIGGAVVAGALLYHYESMSDSQPSN